MVTEPEVTRLLGSPRAFRKFSLDALVNLATAAGPVLEIHVAEAA